MPTSSPSASSQVGIAIGLSRAGYVGALAAWFGFTMPSATAMVLFAYGISRLGDVAGSGWLHGLKIAAVAVVAVAVLGMMRTLTPDRERATIAAAAAVAMLAAPSAFTQVLIILLGGIVGALILPATPPPADDALALQVGRGAGAVMITLFFALLVGLPLLAASVPSQSVKLIDVFYRAGFSRVRRRPRRLAATSKRPVVSRGWVSNDEFLAGYGAAQAVPGPLFTFAAYLGAAMTPKPNGWEGALLCLVAIFLPSFLLVIGALPFWEELRRRKSARSALAGINAAVTSRLPSRPSCSFSSGKRHLGS